MDKTGSAAGLPATEHASVAADRPVEARPAVFLMINSLETGGSERQFVELVRALDRERYVVNLGHLMKKGSLLSQLGSMHHFPLGGSLYGVQSIRARYRLSRYLRQSHTSIAHAFDFYTNLAMIPAARLARVPVIIGSQRQLGDLLTPAQARAQCMIFRWADCVVCNSNAAAQLLLRQGLPRDRVTVIANGLPSTAFAETAPALPRRPHLFRLAMIARMNTQAKNHGLLLRALAGLSDRICWELLLVGDGPLRSALEGEAESLGICGRVRFLGDRQDIPAVLASVDATVLPSASESLSNAILESMAAGVPVIATQVGANPELLEPDRGILVPAEEESLRQAIERLARNAALRQTLGRNARQFARENFTVDRMRRSYEHLYSHWLKRNRWRPKQATQAPMATPFEAKLRVAIVAASARYVGGQSVQADLLLRNWGDDGDVRAHFIPIDPPLPAVLSWAERIPGLRTVVREPVYLWALWRGLRDTDVAHIFSASYWSFLIAPVPAWLVARVRGAKTLIHYHSGEARDHLQRFRSAAPLLRRMGTIVVPSRYLVDVFHEFGVQAEVVPNLVDLDQFSYRKRQPLRPHLICTRGFHPYYRVDLVIRAFVEVGKQFPNARLDLVGGGELEGEISGLIDQLELSGVHRRGLVPHCEIAAAYDAADIFVNASNLDNTPVSILEAFAAGTPVVSTAPDGIRYLVDDGRTGLLSPPGDVAALAANIMRLLHDPKLATRLAGNARAELARYGWSEVRGAWLAVYRTLAPQAPERAEEKVQTLDICGDSKKP